MFVTKELRLNKFVSRPFVSARALFMAKGASPAVVTSKETSECYNSPSIDCASKTKMLGLASEIVSQAVKEHNTAGKVDSLKKEPAKLK